MLRYGYLGVGWGGAITFMSTCTHMSCYVMVILGWGGVGWGNNVHVNLHTHVMLRYGYLGVGWGGVGWGGAITFMSSLQPASKVWDRAPWKL